MMRGLRLLSASFLEINVLPRIRAIRGSLTSCFDNWHAVLTDEFWDVVNHVPVPGRA
jgi:hypothetical protein